MSNYLDNNPKKFLALLALQFTKWGFQSLHLDKLYVPSAWFIPLRYGEGHKIKSVDGLAEL